MMNKKYNIVFFVALMLIILSASISWLNYSVSINNAHKQLKEHSLPLSLDNIYTEIQKNIIEPYLLSSMMANDTFVQDWIVNEEKNHDKIIKYLESIKNKYSMFNTFLVSDTTKKYYTQDGFIEIMKEDNPINKWYFDFKKQQDTHEINLDFNNNFSNNLIMFINYKIFDPKYHFLGVTGVAIKLSYIDDMLEKFRSNHNFIITFFNKNGDIVLAERSINKYKNIKQMQYLDGMEDIILSKDTNITEYVKDGIPYIQNTKYIKELDLYLAVEVKVTKYIEDVQNVFYFNLFISFAITLLIASILLIILRKHHSKLEYLAQYDSLTKVLNRRSFEENLNYAFLKKIDNKLSLIFIDIDNFKIINDTFGHSKGDEALCKVTKILQKNTRKNDLVGRWGGEEFIIALIDTTLEDAQKKTEILRKSIEDLILLNDNTVFKVTASFGLTQVKNDDTLDTLIGRADDAMYVSKDNGKNQITVLK